MASGNDGNGGWGWKGKSSRLYEFPNSEDDQRPGIDTAPLSRARLGYTDFYEWLAVSVGPDIFRPVFEDAKNIYTYFQGVLLENDQFTPAEIDAGFIQQPFIDASELPIPPPTGLVTPAFAVVREGASKIQVYYWDFLNQTGWQGTDYPWKSPFLPPEFVLDQNVGYSSVLGNFQFSFGSEIKIVQACTATDITSRVGAAGGTHAFDVRLSTTPGPGTPALASYSNVIASGNHTFTTTGWETIATISQSLNVDDWILTSIYGSPSTSFFDIPTERANGNLNENFGQLNAGLYAFVGAPTPGNIIIPTVRATTTCYGLCTPLLG
jgi:hypothetical protein